MADRKYFLLSIIIIVALFLTLYVDAKTPPAPNIKIDTDIERKINDEGSANVIIRTEKLSTRDFNKRLQNAGVELRNQETHNIIQGFSGRMTKADLKKLRSSGIEMEIYEDKVFYITPKKSGGKLQTTLDTSTRVIGANYSWNILNITGRNITVAVIDTGIEYTHPDLGGCLGIDCKVLDGYDFMNADSDPIDDNGHGTHVAGIISANGSVVGVAPDSKLYALKACDSEGACTSSRIISSIEWALNNSADIISISIGGSYSDQLVGNSGKDPTSLAIDAAVDAGIPVVVSSGNTGNGISTINVPGASIKAITVGSVDDRGTVDPSDDVMATTSSRGPGGFGRLDPDISAPGVGIISTYIGGINESMSGTSMAAPHVSGAIALLLEQNGSLTPTQIRAILIDSSRNISGKVFDKGAGELDVQNALTNNMHILVEGEDVAGNIVTNDRWEFVALDTHEANFTIYNNNNYSVNITHTFHSFDNMENNEKLDTAQFSILDVEIAAESDITFQVNFTFNDSYIDKYGTYGGYIIFEAAGTGETAINLSVPVVITIPIRKYGYITRTLTNSGDTGGDVIFYAYYNNRSDNQTIGINWSSSSNDLDLYLYNSTGDLIDYGGYGSTINETLITTDNDNIKWLRIHGYSFSGSPFYFSINITDNDNILPNITGISHGNASDVRINTNITLEINYSDADGDIINLTINDTSYNMINDSGSRAFYNKYVENSHNITITLIDDYGGTYSYTHEVIAYNPLSITTYYPSDTDVIISENSSIGFTQESADADIQTLYYYWYVNGTLNSTEQNFTFNHSLFVGTSFDIIFTVSNNETNLSINWDLTIDNTGPIVTINNSNYSVNSTLRIYYAVSDISSVSSCWYELNNSNTSISGCNNFTLYLSNSQYNITIYANDTYGFQGYDVLQLTVNDTTPPVLSSLLPNTTQDPEDNAVLQVITNENASCRYGYVDEEYEDMTRQFVDNIFNHTKEYNIDPEEEYRFYVRCIDTAGNANDESSSIRFNTSEEEESGGGGSNNIYVPPQSTGLDNFASTEATLEYSSLIVEASESVHLNNPSPSMSFYSLDIGLNKAISNVLIEIIELKTEPAAMSVFHNDRRRYGIIEIRHTDMDDYAIKNAKIFFKVSKAWFAANSIEKEDVTLYRYLDDMGIWSDLETKLTGELGEYYTYDAASPGLSLFIIGTASSDPSLMIDTPVNNTSPVPEVINNNITNTTDESVLVRKSIEERQLEITDNSDKTDSLTDNPKNFVPMIIIIFVIMVIIGSYFFLKSTGTIQKLPAMFKKMKKEKEKAIDPMIEKYEKIIENIKKEYYAEGQKLHQQYNGLMRGLDPKNPEHNHKIQEIHIQHHNLVMNLHTKYQSQAENMQKIIKQIKAKQFLESKSEDKPHLNTETSKGS